MTGNTEPKTLDQEILTAILSSNTSLMAFDDISQSFSYFANVEDWRKLFDANFNTATRVWNSFTFGFKIPYKLGNIVIFANDTSKLQSIRILYMNGVIEELHKVSDLASVAAVYEAPTRELPVISCSFTVTPSNDFEINEIIVVKGPPVINTVVPARRSYGLVMPDEIIVDNTGMQWDGNWKWMFERLGAFGNNLGELWTHPATGGGATDPFYVHLMPGRCLQGIGFRSVDFPGIPAANLPNAINVEVTYVDETTEVVACTGTNSNLFGQPVKTNVPIKSFEVQPFVPPIPGDPARIHQLGIYTADATAVIPGGPGGGLDVFVKDFATGLRADVLTLPNGKNALVVDTELDFHTDNVTINNLKNVVYPSVPGPVAADTPIMARADSNGHLQVTLENIAHARINPATEDTLAAIKAQTDKLTFTGGDLNININADAVGLATEATLAAFAGVAATEATLATIAGTVATEATLAFIAGTVATEATLAAMAGIVATEATLATIAGTVATEATLAFIAGTVATEATLAFIAGTVATEATLAIIQGDTTSLDTKVPAKGQALMAGSMPVVIASDQSSVPVSISTESPIVYNSTGNAGISISTSESGAFKLDHITIHFNVAPTTSENVEVQVDANDGPAYDTTIYAVDPASTSAKDIFWAPDKDITFESGDQLRLSFANTDGRTFGARVVVKRL